MMDDDVREAHVAAMRLKGFHGGNFDHTCSAGTCTRPAHWRYYPEQNPQLARLAAPEGAYEVYAVAGEDGCPNGTGYAVLRVHTTGRQEVYEAAALVTDYADAVRLACEMAVTEMKDTMG